MHPSIAIVLLIAEAACESSQLIRLVGEEHERLAEHVADEVQQPEAGGRSTIRSGRAPPQQGWVGI
jgi:hypothetical protein